MNCAVGVGPDNLVVRCVVSGRPVNLFTRAARQGPILQDSAVPRPTDHNSAVGAVFTWVRAVWIELDKAILKLVRICRGVLGSRVLLEPYRSP